MTTYSSTPEPSPALVAAVGPASAPTSPAPATPSAVPSATVVQASITTTPYETLIRYNADGTIRGAHHVFMQSISDGKGNVHKQLTPPQALNVADGQNGLNLSTVMSNAQRDALAQLTAANETVSKLKLQRHDRDMKLQNQLTAANAQIAALKKRFGVA